MFITKFPTPALVTYASICCAIAGLGFAFTLTTWAIILLLVCAILDMFDGHFARSFKRDRFENNFGVAIDSLADVLAFIALPAIIFVAIVGNNIGIIIPMFYALSGITRLAVFTAEAKAGTKIIYYKGLPVTVAGFVIPIAYFISHSNARLIFCFTYIVLAVLFVLNIKIKKP